MSLCWSNIVCDDGEVVPPSVCERGWRGKPCEKCPKAFSRVTRCTIILSVVALVVASTAYADILINFAS